MKVYTFALGLILAFGGAAGAQEQQPSQQKESRDRAGDDVKVMYGKLKEFTKGSKIVIALEQSPDKSYNLNDKDTSINIADGLVVGDNVKVSESKKDGRHHVEIARQTAAADSQRSRSDGSQQQK